MIDAKMVAELRARTGAGMVDCKKALEAANGDMEKAIEVLRTTGALKAAKKNAERETAEGIIEAYVHTNGRVGVLVELQCETDFVARNPDYKELAHEIAMQIAAMAPLYVQPSDIPPTMVEKERHAYMSEDALANKPEDIKAKIVEGKLNKWYQDICLLSQPWVKDEDITIGELIARNVAKIGEKIIVARFSRLELSAAKTETEEESL